MFTEGKRTEKETLRCFTVQSREIDNRIKIERPNNSIVSFPPLTPLGSLFSKREYIGQFYYVDVYVMKRLTSKL